MAFEQTTRNGRRLAQSAILPTRALPRFNVSDLLFYVRQMLAGTPAVVDIEPSLTAEEVSPASARVWTRPKSPPTAGIRIDDIVVSVAGHDRPAFAAEQFAELDDSDWPGGRGELARGRAHVVVAEVGAGFGGLDYNHDRSVAVTVVAAAAARLVETIGLVWQASLRCVPADRLPELMQVLEEERVPVALWLGARQVPADADRPAALVTRGLYPLLGAEIEVGLSRPPSNTELDIARRLAEEIIGSGAWPEHGARLDFGKGYGFLVRHDPRGRGDDVPALVLVPEAQPAIVGAA
jgi:hypothetical protein